MNAGENGGRLKARFRKQEQYKLLGRTIQKDFRRFAMGITVEAIYESGVLKPLKPIDALQEHERVRITVQPVGVVAEQRRERIKLDQAVAHEIAESPEYDLLAE